jgi:formylglycine-generating enzyme required for sulfatase activity
VANIRIIEPLGTRQVSLPLLIGGRASGDPAVQLVIPDAGVALRIEERGAQYRLGLVGASDSLSGATLNGMAVHGDVALASGDVIALGAVQMLFHEQDGGADLEVWHPVGNSTIAPLMQEQLPGEEIAAGVREIIAAGDDPTASNATAPLIASRRARPARVLGILAAVVGALLIATLFAFVPVQLQVTPQSASVTTPGSLHLHMGDRMFLLPGQHDFVATHAGYADARRTVEVQRGATDPLRLELGLLPGMLNVDTGGIQAQVLVDGEAVGAVPGKVKVPAGQHDVIVRAPRYVDVVTSLNILGAGKEQSLQAKLQPAFGWLVLDTVPAGAQVMVDGKEVGVAPLRVELDSGLRDLALNASGRRAWRSQVAISAGQTLDLGIVDLAVPSRTVVVPKPEAPVAAAGVGEAPAAPKPAVLPPPAARVQSPLIGTLVLLPAGQFMQGSERREQGRRSNETLRQVTLSRAFYMAETEVTNGQFNAFKSGHVSGIAWNKTLDLDRQAVSSVSWEDAVEFCNWLSQREGLPVAYERRDGRWQLVMPYNHGYRLPTEAEWEYAARYVDGRRWNRYDWGDATPPPAGTDNLAGQEYTPAANNPEVRDVVTLPGYRDEYVVIAPVGSLGRTPMGLADMGGNVSEWTHDVYVSLPESAAVTDPRGPDVVGAHAIRGANWRTAAMAELRLAWRERAAGPSQTIGFRVVRSVEIPQ